MEKEELEMKMRKQKMENEELEMKMRMENLQLESELAEVEARERALMEAEEQGSQTRPGVASVQAVCPAEPNERTGHAEDVVGNEQPLVTVQSDAGASEARADQMNFRKYPPQPDLNASQPDATQVILSQIQQSRLPTPELPVFKGDVTQYRSFIRAFDSRIGSKTDSDSERLFYLEQYCAGKPRDIIRGCLHMTEDV